MSALTGCGAISDRASYAEDSGGDKPRPYERNGGRCRRDDMGIGPYE